MGSEQTWSRQGFKGEEEMLFPKLHMAWGIREEKE